MLPNFTPVVRTYTNYRIAKLQRQEASAVQRDTLLNLVRKGARTRFGIDHGLSEVSSIKDFQERVPLRRYEDFWRDYWCSQFPTMKDLTWPGVVPFHCVSSGTSSGVTKYIPYTMEMVRSNSKAGVDLFAYHLNNCPNSKLFGGKSFMLGGSTDLTSYEGGVYSGDLSGIAVKTSPWWIKPFSFPPIKMALESDWEKKIDLLASASLQEDIRLLAGVPSWILILFEKLRAITGKDSICDIYPNLEVLIHGGVKFDPYHDLFKKLLVGSKAETREVYPASEGFIAIQDGGYGEGLRLNCDHNIFYEFIPVEELTSSKPVRHSVVDLELDVNYAVVLTTAAGLWGYILGDTVRFLSKSPPRLIITGRTSYMLSAFGEHLIEEEIEKGISEAASAVKIEIIDFSVGPIYPVSSEELGGHLYFIEAISEPPDEIKLNRFADILDAKLSELNDDYRSHRAQGFGLRPPKVIAVPHGTFREWMKSRGKLGGQNKVPRIVTDPELFTNLKNFVAVVKNSH